MSTRCVPGGCVSLSDDECEALVCVAAVMVYRQFVPGGLRASEGRTSANGDVCGPGSELEINREYLLVVDGLGGCLCRGYEYLFVGWVGKVCCSLEGVGLVDVTIGRLFVGWTGVCVLYVHKPGIGAVLSGRTQVSAWSQVAMWSSGSMGWALERILVTLMVHRVCGPDGCKSRDVQTC